MAKQKLRFESLNIYVKDHDASLNFYADLGFKIVKSVTDERINTRATEMKLNKKSDFMIRIIEDIHGDHHECVAMVIIEKLKTQIQEVSKIDIKKEAYFPIDSFMS
jgi:hypothetical protein